MKRETMKDTGEFMHKYQIKDLENISGIKAHTIRIWEQRYEIFEPERTPTNIRYYSDSDLKKLLNIVYLLDRGYKISSFKNMSEDEISSLVHRMSIDDPDTEAFLLAILDYNAMYFDNLIKKSVYNYGVEDSLSKLIYPLIEKIGLLWMTGSINPSHEHFFSNIIRQKLFAWIDALPEPTENHKTFLMFLPYFEQHEIGLLYAYYLARLAGHRVVYLGQNVPTEDVIKATQIINPDYLVCFFIANTEMYNHKLYLLHIAEQLPNYKIIAAGNQVNKLESNISKNLTIIYNPDQYKVFL
ncbi:MAG: MerR family transcriptional regulator [Bacteroidales bacterium]|nr:MerR family transcriptional regulator [Bacteroidales bacterium]